MDGDVNSCVMRYDGVDHNIAEAPGELCGRLIGWLNRSRVIDDDEHRPSTFDGELPTDAYDGPGSLWDPFFVAPLVDGGHVMVLIHDTAQITITGNLD